MDEFFLSHVANSHFEKKKKSSIPLEALLVSWTANRVDDNKEHLIHVKLKIDPQPFLIHDLPQFTE